MLFLREAICPAPGGEGAGGAFWGAGGAGVAAVEDEPVVGDGTLFNRDMALKVPFNIQRSFAVRQPQPVGNPENMSVNSNYRLIVND